MIYSYKGEVLKFKKCIGQFEGFTNATSEKQALNNLTYQCKKKMGLEARTAIKLIPSKIQQIKK